MATKLISNFIFAGIEDNIILVGFADDEFNTKEHILLQKSLEVNEQDKMLGQDKVHITYIDELRSSYGRISKILIKDKTVIINVDKDTAEKLKIEEQMEINLPRSHYDRDNLIYHLELMFKECPSTILVEK